MQEEPDGYDRDLSLRFYLILMTIVTQQEPLHVANSVVKAMADQHPEWVMDEHRTWRAWDQWSGVEWWRGSE